MTFGLSDLQVFGPRAACGTEHRTPNTGRLHRALGAVLLVLVTGAAVASAQEVPELTQPVNDFAHVIDPAHAESMDRTIRALQAATGDVVIVTTIETFAPFGSLEEYANKLFENHGRGIGEKGKDNGLLITVAVKEHKVWIEVGYGLEQYVTDGFAGETSRLYMIPEFRQNNYGAGLEGGLRRVVGRIAQARNVTLEGVPQVAPQSHRHSANVGSAVFTVLFFVALVVFSILGSLARAAQGPRRWGRGPWSGWNSGIGPFGGGWGGFGGGFGGFGGGGGGGFGGFGGGGSGGGGGGGSW